MTSLGLLQLVSPALPVGAFSYSEGFEWLVQEEKITSEATLFEWIEAELLRGQLRIEAASLLPIMEALNHWQIDKTESRRTVVHQWNSWLLALRPAKELRLQQLQMGQSLLYLLGELDHPLPDMTREFAWPVAWAWAGLAWQLPVLEVVEGYLYSWVANQLSAAVRLIPLGPTKAQRLQRKLLPTISAQAEFLVKQDPSKLWTGDVGATMSQLSHAELYSRLFRS